jgi:carboxypeptidase PM20D1
MPGPHTAIGLLSRAIVRVEDHPLPARIDGVTRETFDAIGPELPFGPRVLFANTWLFGPLLKQLFAGSATTNALIRTTTAVTLVGGGTKDNVLPSSAWALVNFRLLPGDSSRAVLAHVRGAVGDPRVNVAFADPGRYAEVTEASKVSPIDSTAYRLLRRTVRQSFPGVVVAPYVVTAATDARHYQGLTDNIYRFLPVRVDSPDLERIHGTDERIARKDYAEAVQFYARLIKNFN